MIMENKETKLKVNSIKELIKLGESNILTPAQYLIVVQSCNPFIGIFLNDYANTFYMANVLKLHLSKWGTSLDKPIFIDSEIDL
jgi:hypothetical protein